MADFKCGDYVTAELEGVFKRLLHVVEQKGATTICVYKNAVNELITVELATVWLTPAKTIQQIIAESGPFPH